MRYFISESVFNDPLPVPAEEIPKTYVPLHEAHVKAAIDQGQVLLAGPKVGEGGGFMVVKAESREALDEFMASDPFVVHGIAHFVVREFKLNDRAPCIQDW